MTLTFSMSYGAYAHITPGWTGEPWNAPAWYLSSAKAATNLPSLVAPSLTRTLAPDVGPEHLKTSSRDMTIFTGRLAFFDSATASGSRYTTVLPPKPPPISEAVTRTLPMSMPSRRAQCARTMKCPCVVHQISAEPSSDVVASAAWGSMYPWWTGAVLNSRSTTTSALAKPASMSPWPISMRLATLEGLSGFGSTPAVNRSSCRSGAPG